MTRKRHIEPPASLHREESDARSFSVLQLAARWQCSPHTVRAAIRRGRLQGFRTGERVWRVAEAEVVRYEQTNAPAKAAS